MEFLRKIRVDLILLYLFVSIPVWIWLFMQPMGERFMSPGITLTSIGQLSSLIGTTLFALSMFFQARLTFLNKLFFNPGSVSKIHHYFGLIGFYLLLLHPVVLAVSYLLISPKLSADFIIGVDWVNLFGLIALFGMMISLFVTLFLTREFRFWKLFHQIMIIVYFLIVLHLIYVSSDISDNIYLAAYIWFVMILGGGAFLIQKSIYYAKKFNLG
jgi:predicted ferric reductase